MTKEQTEQIERGRRLASLELDPNFADFKAELAERIQDLEDERNRFDARIATNSMVLVGYNHELKALKGLRDWMMDEIADGAELLLQKESGKVPA